MNKRERLNSTGVCELHRQMSELSESHIIPKFVLKWMKKTGTGRLRKLKTFNKSSYDGYKKRLLCKACEDKFSKYETWFNKKIFISYLENQNINILNEEELKCFIISILWRTLIFLKNEQKYAHELEIKEAEKEWRNYLLNDVPLKKHENIHFILTDNFGFKSKNEELYFSRVADIDIEEINNECFIYSKFSRFILIGLIKRFESNGFENTSISNEKEFRGCDQKVPKEIHNFFQSKVNQMKDYSDLSEAQKSKNDKLQRKNMGKFVDNDYLKITKKYE